MITPAEKNVKSFLSKLRDIFGKSKATSQEDLIETLNPIIRGWATFHRHIVAKKTFAWIDYRIWQMSWNWARRRHPNKGERWVKRKYFPNEGTRQWTFAPANGKGPRLVNASDTPIVRHIKVKSQAQPFNPQWTTYFKERGRKPNIRETVKKVIGTVKSLFGNPDTPKT